MCIDFLLYSIFIALWIIVPSNCADGSSELVDRTIDKCCNVHSSVELLSGNCVLVNNSASESIESFSQHAQTYLSVLKPPDSRISIRTNNVPWNCTHGKLKPFHFLQTSKQAVENEDHEILWKDRFFTDNTLCIDRDKENLNYHIFSCEKIIQSRVNLTPPRKCCMEKQSVIGNENDNFSCVSTSNKTWNPAVFRSVDDDLYVHEHANYTNALRQFGFPNCSYQTLNNSQDTWFIILEDGSVQVGLKFWFRPVWLKVTPESYCVDDFVNNADQTHVNVHPMHENQILLFCQLERFDEYLFHRRLFGGLCITSSLVILCLLFIYLTLWDKINMASLTQFNVFSSLFVVFGMEGLRVLHQTNGLEAQQTTTCFIIAAVAQYFFFTLNTTWSVMCFDLFWTLWRLENSDIPARKHPKRICAYFIVSWIVPMISTVIAFFVMDMHRTKSSSFEAGVLSYAHRRCSSPIRELGFTTQGIFFLGNLCFFLCTAFFIWKHQRKIRKATNTQRKRQDKNNYNWTSVVLFLKLLVVMGVTSLTLPLDFFFGSHNPLTWYATIIRVTHFIPSWAAFYIFGFNQKNVKMLRKKFPAFKKVWDMISCDKDAHATTSMGTTTPAPVQNEYNLQRTKSTQ